MSLAVMEMMVVVDNQNAADVLHCWEPVCGSRCLYCVIKYVNVHINIRPQEIERSFEAASE